MADRTYWHWVNSPNAWHAVSWREGRWFKFSCGRSNAFTDGLDNEIASRLPADGHLCGSCSRVIAARTDIEAA